MSSKLPSDVLADRSLLRALFEHALDAMLLADDEGRYIDANPAACDLFGLPREQLVGRSLLDFGEPGADVLGTWRAFLAAGRMAGAFSLMRPDGTRRDLDYRAAAHIVPGVHLSILRDVTDQRAMADALRASEEMFEKAFRASPVPLGIATVPEGRFVDVNDAAAALAGRTRDGMIGRTSRELELWADPGHAERLAAAMSETGRTRGFETRLRARSGDVRDVVLSTERIEVRGETCVLWVSLDVTDQNRAERALREHQIFLEEAEAVALVGSWIAAGPDADAPVRWSAGTYRIFGIPVGTALCVQDVMRRMHPDDVDAARRAFDEAIARGTDLELECRILRSPDDVRWIYFRAKIEAAAGGAPSRLVGVVQDVTDRHHFVRDLAEREERYRRIVETTTEGVILIDPQGKMTFVNGRFAEMLGYARDELIGRSIFDYQDDEAAASARRKIEARRRGVAETHEHRMRRRDGSELWARASSNPLFDVHGRFEGSLSLVTDVGARRRAEENQRRLAAIVESSNDAILGVDLDGTISSWNRAAERLYQYTSAEAVGRKIRMLMPDDQAGDELQLLRAIGSGQKLEHFETRRRRKDGSIVEVVVSASPIVDETGRIVGAAKIARDLTERRRMERIEEQLHQAQKLEAIGNLAGGIAHDFNNMLSVIRCVTGLALADMRPGDPLRSDIEDVARAADRAHALTRQLLAFSRQQVAEPAVVAVDDVLADMDRILRRALREDIELTVLPASSGCKVFADPAQIEQVVMNLAVNARDAMPHGGKLTVETAALELDEVYAAEHHDVKPGSYVMLAVTDTGVGIDAATRSRIFEPFFTTKPKGQGTGLGLATVFGIVRQSSGHIFVYSEPGRGTTFKIYLPRTDRTPGAPGSKAPLASLSGTERVLVVEDDELVRRATVSILRRLGYDVLEAVSGGDALLLCEQFEGPIDLLVTDVVMPRMSGPDLARRLTRTRPGMKLLCVSGYTDHTIVHHGIVDGAIPFLQKPLSPDSLGRKVREVLGPRP